MCKVHVYLLLGYSVRRADIVQRRPNPRPTWSSRELLAPRVARSPAPAAPRRARRGVGRRNRGRSDNETILEALVTVIGRKEYATSDEGRYWIELPAGELPAPRVGGPAPAGAREERPHRGRARGRGRHHARARRPRSGRGHRGGGRGRARERRRSSSCGRTRRRRRTRSARRTSRMTRRTVTRRTHGSSASSAPPSSTAATSSCAASAIATRTRSSTAPPVPSPGAGPSSGAARHVPDARDQRSTVSKTFTPTCRATSPGGSLDIHTREPPNRFLLQANARRRLQHGEHLRARLGYPAARRTGSGSTTAPQAAKRSTGSEGHASLHGRQPGHAAGKSDQWADGDGLTFNLPERHRQRRGRRLVQAETRAARLRRTA